MAAPRMTTLHDRVRFLTPQLPAADAIERYFRHSRDQRWFSNDGPCLQMFTERAEALLGRGLQVVPTANGTAALMLALRALAGPPRGGCDEVVLPSFTFAATASAALARAGARVPGRSRRRSRRVLDIRHPSAAVAVRPLEGAV